MRAVYIFLLLTELAVQKVLSSENTHTNKTYCVAEYLRQYGYLNVTENEITSIDHTELKEALEIFQEYYNITKDGELNEMTLNLTNRPRCGVVDDPAFSVYHYKWNKDIIKWHYGFVNSTYMELARKAFEIWSQAANLKFEHDPKHPDIFIMNTRYNHKQYLNRHFCSTPLDGIGGKLAHAQLPSSRDIPLEIHIDQDEMWYLGMDHPELPEFQVSLLAVLLHEIGHTLGITHSNYENSLMFAYYNHYDYRLTLHEDDILAAQFLYGPPLEPQKEDDPVQGNDDDAEGAPEYPEDRFRAEPNVAKNNTHRPTLCELDNVRQLLIINNLLYLFHEKWFWYVDMEVTERIDIVGPQLITDWLPFLPEQDFNGFDALYRRPSGEIVIFIKGLIYMVNYPTMELVEGRPMNIISAGLPRNARIQAIVNTYSARTLIFHSGEFIVEMDECTFRPKSQARHKKLMPQIPTGIQSAFRHTNGILYFFREKDVYEYSEFNNTMVRAGRNDLNLFGIPCPKNYPSDLSSIANDLKTIVSRMDNIIDN